MSLFSRIFSKDKEPADYGILNTDVHSHFIPEIDDGAKTIEDSIELLKAMQDFGYKKAITTPHVMGDHYRNTPEIILSGLEKVRERAKNEGLSIQIEAAAEYNVDSELEAKINAKEILTFGNKYVLFEMPFSAEPTNLKEIIFAFQTNGYKPVLAHVERYNFWHDQEVKIDDMLNRGVLLQLNINSLTGFYGPGVKKMAEKLIDRGVISILGSDCHHVGHIDLMQKARVKPYLHKILNSSKLINQAL